MTVTKATIAFGVLVYGLLWIVALNGASSLIPILAIPLVLAVLVGAGTLMQNFMGIPGRSPKFRRPEDDENK
jgi:hypothetical protein